MFGLILAGLMRRRDDGIVPFTVMSCDNIPHNGHVTSDGVIGLARLIDEDLANWVSDNVAFPNGMVDRITPATTDRERGILAKEFGLEDNWPVFCEPFKQWVLEDHFTDGRPPLEKVGVQFVKDVAPYELMKIRILNGGHATIAYPAGLMDIHFVHEAMQEPLVRGFLAKLEHDEIIPTVPPVPDTVLEDYYQLIERRFSNPKIGDTIRRLCLDGSNRQPKFIIPTIADRLKAGKERRRAGAGIGALVPLLLRHHRQRRRHRAQRSELGPAAGDREGGEGRASAPGLPWRTSMAMSAARRSSPRPLPHALNVLWANGARATLTRYIAGKL